MTSLRDPFSAVRQAQFDAQLDFFNAVTSQAVESAGRVAALNLAASRDAAQRSLGTTFALINSRDPRDFLTLGGQAEEGMRSLFAYGRELLGIASGIRPPVLRPLALSQEQAVETVEVIERRVEPVVEASAPAAEPLVVVEAEPASVVDIEPAPVAAPSPIAAAVAQGEAHAAVLPHPAAAPIPVAAEVALPKIELPRASARRKK